jgi:hypothetical protein
VDVGLRLVRTAFVVLAAAVRQQLDDDGAGRPTTDRTDANVDAGLSGPGFAGTGSVGDAYDNALMESFVDSFTN